MASLLAGKVSAWESDVVPCRACACDGCVYRVNHWEQYCCGTCKAVAGVSEPPQAKGDQMQCSAHDHDCARLKIETLRSSWWESVPSNPSIGEEGQWLVVPPASFAEVIEPAPVVLFLCGNGHVDKRQDFLSGGVDLLLLNETLHHSCTVIAPLPTTNNGLLRNSGHQNSWDEDAVWASFTEVLRRLGPARVDLARLCATGISMGAAGVWHLALRYGEMLAAVAPISGRCEWPGDSWPWDAWSPCMEVSNRLQRVALRAYQTSSDSYAGHPGKDIDCLMRDVEGQTTEITVPGMDPGSSCTVCVRQWEQKEGKAVMEFWEVAGPLGDWTVDGHRERFNDHLLYHRIYPRQEWQLSSFFLQHRAAECIRLDLGCA